MFFHAMNAAFGSPARVRVLRVLAQTGRDLTGREVERLAGVAHQSARDALVTLTDLGVLTRVSTGRQHHYSLTKGSILGAGILALFAAESDRVRFVFEWLRCFARDPDCALPPDAPPDSRVLLRPTPSTPEPIVTLVLFGSAARGDDRPDSDLDVCIVVEDDAAIASVQRAFVDAAREAEPYVGVLLSGLVLSQSMLKDWAAARNELIVGITRDERIVVGPGVDSLVRGITAQQIAGTARAVQ